MRPIVNMPEKDRATDIGNTYSKFGKDRAFGSGDILADTETDRHTHHNTSQPLPRAKLLQLEASSCFDRTPTCDELRFALKSMDR